MPTPLAVTLCAAALAGLAACSSANTNASFDATAAAEGRVVAPKSFWTGTGLVESVAAVHAASGTPSASTGGSSQPRTLYRLYLNMDDGHTQAVDVDSAGFQPKDRVQITPEGRVVRFAGGR